LSSSSIPWGKRREIVAVDGLRFGKTTRFAFDQSKYSVESAVDQNSRSASSERKTGISLTRFGRDVVIGGSLLAAHRTGRDHADEVAADGEDHGERAVGVGAPQHVVATLPA